LRALAVARADRLWYVPTMKPSRKTDAEIAADKARQRDIALLQAIEDNPFDAADEAMFAMFEREGWSHEECLAYIREQALKAAPSQAAE